MNFNITEIFFNKMIGKLMVAKIDVTEIDRYELNVALFVSGFYFVQVFSVI